ncbi:hypothetical protein BCR44DRAFT_168499, partial [Catenaria anguillulae PL171]
LPSPRPNKQPMFSPYPWAHYHDNHATSAHAPPTDLGATHSASFQQVDRVVHMDPDSQAAFDSILLIQDAVLALEMAAARAQTILQPFRAWVAAAVVADLTAEKPYSLADKDRITAIVKHAWEVGSKAGVNKETWMAVALHVELELFATFAASVFCDKAIHLGLGESSSGGASSLAAEIDQLIDAGALHCARAALHRATRHYPISVRLQKQYAGFKSEHQSLVSLYSATQQTGRDSPSAFSSSADDDDADDDDSETGPRKALLSPMNHARGSDNNDYAPHHPTNLLSAFGNWTRSLPRAKSTPDVVDVDGSDTESAGAAPRTHVSPRLANASAATAVTLGSTSGPSASNHTQLTTAS